MFDKEKEMRVKQFVITPAAGKRLIAKAVLLHEAVASAMRDGTIVIVAGTTNGYVAEEVLRTIGESEEFERRRFFRGITTPPHVATTDTGRLPDESEFPGDIVIVKGKWLKGKTVFDVVDDLSAGDVVLKGANAFDPQTRQAGILIGHPKGGTIVAALQAVVGRRVRLILPVGLEKRVHLGLHEVAMLLNAPGASGARFLPVPGEVLTEIESLGLLSGVEVHLIAGGGVCGAEGAVWLAVQGEDENISKATAILSSVVDEPPFML
jgi:hypothetical protein